MPTSQSRTIAFDVLLRVLKQDAYADEALRSELGDSVKGEDAGLATEMVFGVLRWQRLLDFFIDRRLKKPATIADLEVRIALRLGPSADAGREFSRAGTGQEPTTIAHG